MSQVFQYRLLQYVHSDLLSERLNVGVLFYFPNDNVAIFRHPRALGRFKELYLGNFPDQLILATLKGITARCNRLNESNKGLFDGIPLESFESVVDRLIPEDSTALRFDRVHTAVLYNTRERVVNEYYDLLFKYFEEPQNTLKRNDEEFIAKQLKGYLKKIDPYYQKFINSDVSIIAPILPDGYFPFDFSWNNHVTHYVKPLSFDLSESKSINAKAAQYYGYLSAISNEIGDSKIDIITSIPQKKSLWPQYDKAIEMIDKVDIKKEIIDQDHYAKYAQLILDSAENLNHSTQKKE